MNNSSAFRIPLYCIIVMLCVVRSASAASVPCAMGNETSIMDVTYCQLGNQLNVPARWLDSIFANPGQKSGGKIQVTALLGTRFYDDKTIETVSAVRARVFLPNLEDKLRIQITTSQNTKANDSQGPAKEPQSTGLQTAVSAIFTPALGSAQIGLGWSLKNNLVILGQASLPLKFGDNSSQWGMIPRILWNKDDGNTWVNQFYWDHYFSPTLMIGLDNSLRYRVNTDWTSRISTLRSRLFRGKWTYQAALGTQWIEDPLSDNNTHWVQISAEHTLGRPWLKGQFVPAVIWDEAIGPEGKPQITFNLIATLN